MGEGGGGGRRSHVDNGGPSFSCRLTNISGSALFACYPISGFQIRMG